MSVGAGAAELRRALPLAAVFALNMAMCSIADAVATAGFIVRFGPAAMVWLWAGTLAASLLATGAVGAFIDRVPRDRLLAVLIASATAVYAVAGALFRVGAAAPVLYVALFVAADQQLFLFPVVFWTLANDRFRAAEGQRVFPLIQSGLAAGQLAGCGAVAALAGGLRRPAALSPIFMLVDVALGLAAAILLGGAARGHPAPRRTPEGGGAREGVEVALDYLRNVPVVRAVAVGALLMEMALLLVQYRFIFALASRGGVARVETLFAVYTGAAVGATAIVQWAVARRWLERVGLKRAFGALPAVTLLGAAVALACPALWGAGAAQAAAQATKWGWDGPARSAFQGLLPAARRGRVASFLDACLAALGALGACALLAAMLALARRPAGLAHWFGPAYLCAAGGAAAGGLWCARLVRLRYDDGMLNWRLGGRRRSRALDALDF